MKEPQIDNDENMEISQEDSIGKKEHQIDNDEKMEISQEDSIGKMEISFIQVCRNYFRVHSWHLKLGVSYMVEFIIFFYVII